MMCTRLSLGDDGLYAGTEEMLAIGIDIGTSASAVTLVHLQPGAAPKPRTVAHWPHSQELKIPSIVLYDSSGVAKAFCAESEDEFIEIQAEAQGWKKAENFKMLLHPPTMMPVTLASSAGSSGASSTASAFDIVPTLPSGVSIEQVYADLISYLVKHARSWFEGVALQGEEIWNKLISTSTIILAHPDGWHDAQQDVLRNALYRSGMLSQNDPPHRLEFIRESEASTHWMLQVNETALRVGSAFTIVDAGGSTVDTGLYIVETLSPQLTLREAKASDSIQAGGVFVTAAGEALIASKLKGSRFDTVDYIKEATELFETKIKRKFVGNEPKVFVRVGGHEDNDARTGVQKGRLTFTGDEVEEVCFRPCVSQIVASAKRQTRIGDLTASHIMLVGGFGESPHLKKTLRETFEPQGIKVITSDDPSKKAVAEGSVIWFVKRLVVARAARSTFGIALVYPYNRDNDEHLARGHCVLPDNTRGVRGGFSTVIAKDTIVGTDELITTPYTRLITERSHLKLFEVELYAYDGSDARPAWCLDAYGNFLPGFRRVCFIQAGLSPLERILTPRPGAGGVPFFEVTFTIGVSFGTNSLKAKLLWSENGEHREGPAAIVLSALRGNV